MLQEACPDLYILNVEVNTPPLGRLTTFSNIYYIAHRLRVELLSHPELRNGYNFIAASLGGIWARVILQEFNQDPIGFSIVNLITWASPHKGVYGIPLVNNEGSFPQRMNKNLWQIFYTTTFQQSLSIAELWHDPSQDAAYKTSIVLPYLNNEILHPKNVLYKSNIQSLHSFHVFASPTQDHVIVPPESASFGFYYPNDPTGPIQPYKDTNSYRFDVLGIRSLAESGRFTIVNVECAHDQFAANPTVQSLTLEALGIEPPSATAVSKNISRVEHVSIQIGKLPLEKAQILVMKKELEKEKKKAIDSTRKQQICARLQSFKMQLDLIQKFKTTRTSYLWWDQQFESSRWKRFLHRWQFREDEIGGYLRKGEIVHFEHLPAGYSPFF